MKKSIFIALAFYAFSYVAIGQIKTPAASPLGSFEQKVGLTDISMEYSRPGVKGRTIFGDLVPYDKMWRTGANASTKIEFSNDVTVAGQELPKGKYALYTIPGLEEWTLIFHNNVDHWGTGGDKYNAEEDALRVSVKPEIMDFSVESMSFDINNISNHGADLMFFWSNVMLSVPVGVNTNKTVLASIEKAMSGPNYNDKYKAAVYYMENDQDINQAMTWFDEATEGEGGEKFWIMRQKSICQAKLGKYKEAMATAEKSKVLAKAADNMQYVKFNEKAIAKWAEM